MTTKVKGCNNPDFFFQKWKNLPWKAHGRRVFKLQVRMWKATRRKDKATVLFLQRLISRSYSARLLAICQVTQLNAGKKTAGVDGKKSLSCKERFQLESVLRTQVSTWKSSKLKSVPIPKKSEGTRMLKMLTIYDRAWQCLVKLSIEPAHEAIFHARSYGFRPGRSPWDAQNWDAQKLILSQLSSRANGIRKRILEVDREKCFDRINHNELMRRVKAPCELKQGLWKAPKAGGDPTEYPSQDRGTPQGGVIRPLLANIALNGIEDCGGFAPYGRWKHYPAPGIRYADDMVFILKPN
ncbi:reverse transcriptase N-terminal domain-containing protein, partial [Candidatus Synechococcus spongiarum]|uniref:reverse transcriptase N-terminal domain-containing protein n=1 Tax=Candidatus Synechococcus spongiarum TaxID=431041 RepID=UPI00156739E1